MAKRKRGHYIKDVLLQMAIEKLAGSTNWSPKQIWLALKEDEKWQGKVPSLRTIQTMVKELRPPDTSGVWTFAGAQGDEAVLVLPVVAAVAVVTEGQRQHVTNAEAAWIRRIRRLARELDLWAVYRLARLYLLREARGETTEDIDLYLAFAPWRNPEAGSHYQKLMESGRIPPGPMFMIREGTHEVNAEVTLLRDEIAAEPKFVELWRRALEMDHLFPGAWQEYLDAKYRRGGES